EDQTPLMKTLPKGVNRAGVATPLRRGAPRLVVGQSHPSGATASILAAAGSAGRHPHTLPAHGEIMASAVGYGALGHDQPRACIRRPRRRLVPSTALREARSTLLAGPRPGLETPLSRASTGEAD